MSPISGTHDLLVEACDPAHPYLVGVRLGMGLGARCQVASLLSDVVAREPAPEVVVDFSACAGAVHVTLVDADGAPVVIPGATVSAPSACPAPRSRSARTRPGS